jgi:mannose-1-phosphate guanylyltransferase
MHSMLSKVEPWVVVLAAGSGQRLSRLTIDQRGAAVPKQYCSLNGGRTLLEDSLSRARGLTPVCQIATIVATAHRQWWSPLLRDMPNENIIEQPQNRGTAVGIALAALRIQQRDPEAIVVFLPSDHFIRDEVSVGQAVRRGLDHVSREPGALLLLGITPDEADTELGYIVPAEERASGVFKVSRFVEKPDRATAEALLSNNAVWNSFILAARASTVLAFIARRHAPVIEQISAALTADQRAPGRHLEVAYDRLPEIDFSRHILSGAENDLRVLPVHRCGWTDLGTPARVGRCVEQLGVRVCRSAHRHQGRSPFPDLASAYWEFSLAG